jgi:hypothetical protein
MKRRFLNPSRLRSRREDAGVAGVQDVGICSDLTCSALSDFENSELLPVLSHLLVISIVIDYNHLLLVFSHLFDSCHCVLMKKRRFLNPMKLKKTKVKRTIHPPLVCVRVRMSFHSMWIHSMWISFRQKRGKGISLPLSDFSFSDLGCRLTLAFSPNSGRLHH